MKKMLLGAVGLSAVLASCGTDITVGFAPVTIKAVNSYTSDWYRNVTDPTTGQNRQEYVICDNRSTTVTMDVSWTGPLSQLSARFEGAQGGRPNVERTTGTFPIDSTGRDTFTYTFAPGVAPLSAAKGKASAPLTAQAIIVNPVNKGTTYVTVWGYNPDGQKSAEFKAPQGIPVVTCS